MDGRSWGIIYVKDTEKKIYSDLIRVDGQPGITKFFSKKNQYVDRVEYLTENAGYRDKSFKNGTIITTMKYDYDSNNNFISKIEYEEGIPLFQVIRKIEYY